MRRGFIRKMLTAIAIITIFMNCLRPGITKAAYNFIEVNLLYNGEDTGIRIVTNKNGVKLGYSKNSGVKILVEDGNAFKDLNKNGKLDKYEDWRLEIDDRAKDLASQMSINEIAGLMLYSAHQAIPTPGSGWGSGTYDGKPYVEGVTDPSHLSDQQKSFIKDDNLRHILITKVKSPEIAVMWNNNGQAYAESLGLGIPLNNSSDPRHGTDSSAEYNAGSGGHISMWPSSIGMAATFDPDLVERFGEIASQEYRALGISTALSPQIDLATDPRWSRITGTFGESSKLSADMARAYIDGFQTTKSKNGWGETSVNAMVKHWPGGGTGEGGRDAHYGFGKYAVYPGKNFSEHLIPFTEGAFDLKKGTLKAAAIMPYYTISYNQDPTEGNVGNSYSKYMITDLLREKYGYDGVVCTDWGITKDDLGIDVFGNTPWGVENLTTAEKFYLLLQAGVDQFGGVNTSEGILAGYELGVKDKGEEFMRNRMEQSAVRLLRNIFQVGLFENPYLDVNESVKVVGNSKFMEEGYNAQLKSVVMLKNKNNVLPIKAEGKDNPTVYIPQKFIPETLDRFGNLSKEQWVDSINMNMAKKYFNITSNPSEADAAIVFVDSPDAGLGYDKNGEGNGFYPLTLQYGEYKAEHAREESIAGDSRESDVLNRSYKDKVVTASNIKSLDIILDTEKSMGEKPVIVCVNMKTPMVFGEFESKVDGILVGFNVQDQVFFDILSGKHEPTGLLPLQMPLNMRAVEEQSEDLPFDMECYVDSEGNKYDFLFGLDWNGKINDDRTKKYAIANKETSDDENVIDGFEKYVIHVYKVIFSREADEEGLKFHVDRLKNKTITPNKFLLDIISGKEFLELHKNSEMKIEALYNLLKTEISQDKDKSFWLKEYEKMILIYGDEQKTVEMLLKNMLD